MPNIQVISSASFSIFAQKLEVGREDYLPMVFGTKRESLKQTEWMNNFDDQYYWLIDDLDQAYCLYALHKANKRNALWFSFIMPSDWNQRFDIFDESLPNIIGWFQDAEAYRYFYGKMDTEQTPPTLLKAFLPTFLRNGFNTEYGMTMVRDGQLPIPEDLNLPEGIIQEGYSEGMIDEIAALNSKVFEREGFSFSFENAKRYIAGCVKRPIFKKSAIFLRNQNGQLVGFVWVEDSDGPWLGEFIVDQAYQGQGLGRYLLLEAIRFMSESYPGQNIRVGTARELKRAVRLYESFDFIPYDFGINLNLRKNIGN